MLVILDLTLPGGMGGKEALKKLIEIDPTVNAIVSSGYAMDATMSRYQDFGFRGVIAKPYEAAELGASCTMSSRRIRSIPCRTIRWSTRLPPNERQAPS